MTICFIDGASVFDVVLALTRTTPQDSYQMEWDRALEVTAFLINVDSARLAPSPKPARPAGGAYGVLLEELKEMLSHTIIDDSIKKNALTKTRNWANRSTNKLRKELANFFDNSQSPVSNQAPRWLDAHIMHEWAQHVERHGALFDYEFLAQIAKILDTSVNDIEHIWRSTSDSNTVANMVRGQPTTELFMKSKAAYACCVLLRGRYHEYIALQGSHQSMVHPIRRSILRVGRSDEAIKCEITNTEKFLTNIVLAAAFAEKDPQSRIRQWTRSVSSLRRVRERINLDPQKSDEAARDQAIEIAKRFKIRTEHRRLEQIIDLTVGFGSTVLTSFFLLPWESFAVGGALTAIYAKYKLGNVAISAFTGTRARLNRLSQMKPGRIAEGY